MEMEIVPTHPSKRRADPPICEDFNKKTTFTKPTLCKHCNQDYLSYGIIEQLEKKICFQCQDRIDYLYTKYGYGSF